MMWPCERPLVKRVAAVFAALVVEKDGFSANWAGRVRKL
jgi:hypothetical protein